MCSVKASKTRYYSFSFGCGFLFPQLNIFPGHASTQDDVPMDEEWLGEVALDTNNLIAT